MRKSFALISALVFLCCGTFLARSSTTQEQQAIPDGWIKLDAGAFSLLGRKGWEFQREQGIDSYVGRFSSGDMKLEFDYGLYSSPLDDAKDPKYSIAHEIVDGREARIVCPRTPGHGVTGIYFRKTEGKNKLCLWGQDLNKSNQELAMRMFRTIRFP